MDKQSDSYKPLIDYADVESQIAEGPLYAENSAFAGRRSVSTDHPWRSGYSTRDGAIQMRDLPGGHTWEERRLIELEPVTITGSRRPTPAAGLMIDPETGLASFKFTSEQLTAGGGYGVVQDLAPTTANAMRLGLMESGGRSTADGMSGDQAYSVYMSYGGRAGSRAIAESKWSYSEPNYDLMSSLAGGTGAVLGATDNVGTAIGKSAALSILGRAAPLHTFRIAQIAKAGDLSDAMNVVSSTSKSGQAMAGVANYTKVLGPFGLAASVTEIAADVAGAPVNQGLETFASSATSAAVGGVAVAGAAKLGAWAGFALSGGNPIVAFVSGAALGGGAALGYEFGGGSNAVKGAVKDGLLDINGKKR